MPLAKRNGPRSDPRVALQPEVRTELSYVVVALATTVAMMTAGKPLWALITFVVAFGMFGVWRIGKGRFR